MQHFRFLRRSITALTPLAFSGCLLTARGGRDLDLLWFAAGIILLVLGLRLFMGISGRLDQPPWRRFLAGLLLAACLLLG